MTYFALIFSVLIGAGLVLFINLKDTLIKLFLSFSGAYLLAITVLHLLPEVYQNNNNKYIGLYILLGISIQLLLEFFSKGAEHGHIHSEMIEKSFPWLLFISLSIHAFFGGIPLGRSHDDTLLWAIVIHKIPISIVLVIFLLNSSLSKAKSFYFIAIFALMSPLGYLISESVPFFETYKRPVTAVVVGIFLHVSTIILFESSENHKFNLKKFIAIGLGILLSLLAI